MCVYLYDMSSNSKWCPKCQTTKATDEFHACKKNKDGKQSYCKDCRRPITNAYVKNLYHTDEGYRERSRTYQRKRRIKNRKLLNTYFRDLRAANPNYRIANSLRSRTSHALKGAIKSDSTAKLLGCSMDEFRHHLESLWKPKMSWANYGKKGWHIDHKIPCARFDLTKETEQLKCFHYTNLQPLWESENIAKGDKLLL